MSRHIRNTLFFFLGVFIIMFSVHAETQPAFKKWAFNNISYVYDTPLDACIAIGGQHLNHVAKNPYTSAGVEYYECWGNKKTYGTYEKYSTVNNGGNLYFCPSGQNWTLSGSSCTRPDCVLPQVRQSDGTCAISCVPPEVKQPDGSCKSSCWACVITPSGSCIKPSTCGSGTGPESFQFALASEACGAPCSDAKSDPKECPDGGIKLGTFEGKPLCLTKTPQDDACTAIGGTVIGTMDGKPVCSKPGANPKCPDGSDSQGSINGQPVCNSNVKCSDGSDPTGYVNGQAVCNSGNAGCVAGRTLQVVNGYQRCVPVVGPVTDKQTDQKGSGPGADPKKETEGKTDANGNPIGTGTDKTTQESTTCTGDRCTTKKVTTDNATGEKTTGTTDQTKDEYCKSNPKSSLCTGTSDQSAYCKENPNAVSCLSAGEVSEEGALTEQAAGVSSITLVSIASNETCPSPITLPVGQISWQPICDAASWLKPLILAFAWLAAGLIVLGKVD